MSAAEMMRALVLTVLAAQASVPASPATQQTPTTAAELLDRYSRGDYDSALGVIAAARDLDALREDFEKNGVGWTEAGGTQDEGHRRLVAATLALEIAHARMDQWQKVRSLIEWGCQLLRRGPPTEAERLWQQASIAVAGGALDNALLFNAKTGLRTYQHLSHAEARFSTDPRIVFASRFAIPGPAREGSRTFQAGLEPPLDTPKPGPTRSGRDAGIRDLTTLLSDPVLGADAALRIGHLQLIDVRLDEALRALEMATRGSDRYVTYLAHFLTGRALERLDRLDEAEQAYARALEVMPGTQSAALARAALLVQARRNAEANDLTRVSFSTTPRPPDPWRLYQHGDYYRWPELRTQLRAEIRR